MAPPKRSRKNKKAWRQNIDTTDVDAALEEQTLKERQGAAVDTLQDSDLFFIDAAGAPPDSKPAAPQKRKREKRPLRSQLILQAAHNAQPVPIPPPRRKKGAAGKAATTKQLVTKDGSSALNCNSDGKHSKQHDSALAAGTAVQPAVIDVWTGDAEDNSLSHKTKKRKKSVVTTPIPAVEVDMAGCSYNPDPEQRQDAVALLVASEMKKIIQKDLAPKAPPASTEPQLPANELDLLLVDAEAEENEEELQAEAGAVQQDMGAAPLTAAIAKAQDRKTKKDRNREKRRKILEQQELHRKALKKQRVQLSQLPQLESEIQDQEQEQQLRLERKRVVKAEKALVAPPRLGKHKFEAEPVQVLLSDELTGSLRTITPSFTLLRDRFKSLQKRGIVEPRKPVGLKIAGRKIEYETGARTEKAIALKKEVEALRAARKQLAAK